MYVSQYVWCVAMPVFPYEALPSCSGAILATYVNEKQCAKIHQIQCDTRHLTVDVFLPAVMA